MGAAAKWPSPSSCSRSAWPPWSALLPRVGVGQPHPRQGRGQVPRAQGHHRGLWRRDGQVHRLAKEHSTCPSGKSGGSLGEFGPGQMVKEFNDVVFTTGKVGKVDGPVKTQFGYHLILITKRGDESM